MAQWENDEEIKRFREYLRIPTVQPDVDYTDCVKFLRTQASLLELPISVHEMAPKKPTVVLTLLGEQPDLPSILLNSHMDVVPVNEEKWDYPPFEAKITEDGSIYARGSQDMKCNGMLYLEAMRRIKSSGKKLKRTVHISFVPDEEIGGTDGMKAFSVSEAFDNLNVGFGIDESTPSPEPNTLIAFTRERTSRPIKVTSKGETGHGSLYLDDDAGEKFHFMLNKFMDYRAIQKSRARSNSFLKIGDTTAINLTQIEGGHMVNVLPGSLSAIFDIRISPEENLEEFETMIENWCKESGKGVSFEYLSKNLDVPNINIDSNPFWNIVKNTVRAMGLQIISVTCPGATDARFVRLRNIPVIGFTPIPNTPVRAHGHNEFVRADMYKKGIDIMEKVVEALANV